MSGIFQVCSFGSGEQMDISLRALSSGEQMKMCPDMISARRTFRRELTTNKYRAQHIMKKIADEVINETTHRSATTKRMNACFL